MPMPYGMYYPQNQQMQQIMPQQSNGFVMVRSEMEARNYPVAYGNSVTFKDETAPYIYSKTMGYSQLDRPVFEKYKLIKEEVSEDAPEQKISSNNNIEDIRTEIKSLWIEINKLKKEMIDDAECV